MQLRLKSVLRAVFFALICFGGASIAFGQTPFPGFPVQLDGPVTTLALSASDLDGDGRIELITTTGSELWVGRADGSEVPGFPFKLPTPQGEKAPLLTGAPAVCDLDNDRLKDIVVTDQEKRMWMISARGKVIGGGPKKLGGVAKGPLACLPSPGGARVFAALDSGRLVELSAKSTEAKVIAKIGRGAESGVAIGDVDGDNKLDLVVVGGDARVHVLSQSGKALIKKPYRMAYRSNGVPAIGDINDDGRVDIVVGSQDFKIHASGLDGKSLAGFPIPTQYRIYGETALGDLDGDGVLDVVAGSGDNKLYVVNGKGEALKGFPVALDGRIVATPVLADFNRDGLQEIAVVTQMGSLYLLNRSGRRLKGFPTPLGGKVEIAPLAIDLDKDGAPEIVAQSPLGTIYAFSVRQKKKVQKGVVAWGMMGHDAGRSGRFGPNEGRFKNLGLKQKKPKTTDSIEVAYRFFDLDGDTETGTQIRWFKDGTPQADLNNKSTVDAQLTRKHEKWSYTLQDGSNFKNYGETSPLTRIFKSPAFEIENTVPTQPAVALLPEGIKTTQALLAKIEKASTDVDGDKIQYRYLWLKNNRPQKYRNNPTEVAPKDTRKGERWTVVVAPFDGEREGPVAMVSRVILNTVPSAPQVAFLSEKPRVEDKLSVKIKRPSKDADGDTLEYRYEYSIDGKVLALPTQSSEVPAGVVKKNQTLKVVVTAVDDEADGGVVEASVKVLNTVPSRPKISIYPALPKTDDDVSLVIDSQRIDPDGDAILYEHQWKLNGQAVSHPRTIASKDLKRGVTIEVSVLPKDGESTGEVASAKVVVQNTAPRPPRLRLNTYQMKTDGFAEAQVLEAATDADGDAVNLKYEWMAGNKLVIAGAKLDSNKTQKNTRYTLVVTPMDDKNSGEARRLNVWVANTAPTAAAIELNDLSPFRRAGTKVRISRLATDIDGDALKYRYRWYRNGIREKAFDENKTELRPGEGRRDEQWRIDVVAFDGEVEGPPVSARFVVENERPSAPMVSVSRLGATTLENLSCKLEKASRDPDDDKLRYEYRWYEDGDRILNIPEAEILSKSHTKKNKSYRCDARATDGSLWSDISTSRDLKVINGKPSRPVVSILPTKPSTISNLYCSITKVSTDIDLDQLDYRYTWFVNGRALRAKLKRPNVVPSGVTKRGETYGCVVSVSDKEVVVKSELSKVSIQNTKPGAPVVQLVPQVLRSGSGIKCQIKEKAKDLDNDSLSYQFEWLKDGRKQRFAASSQDVPGRLVKSGEIWQCRVVARDNSTSGPVAESRALLVQPKLTQP